MMLFRAQSQFSSSSKCDQALADWTLRQNEGKFDGFGCEGVIKILKITLKKSKIERDRDSQYCLPTLVVLRSSITEFKIKDTHTLTPGLNFVL